MAEHIRVETSTDTREEASSLATSVVEARLVACAQILGPITSIYWWDGRAQQDEEWLLVMKTGAERLEDLTAHLNEKHSYEVPEVVAVPVVGGNSAYLAWVSEETRPSTGGP